MQIAQLCGSCQSVYEIPDSVYKQMEKTDRAHCPCCGHSNTKQDPLLKHGAQTVHKATIFTVLGAQSSATYSKNFSRSKTNQGKTAFNSFQSLDTFRKKVADMGRVFVLGTAPSLMQYDLDSLYPWPTIGVNNAYRAYPEIDALVMADFGFICNHLGKIKEWQDRHRGKYIFWMRETVRHERELVWREDSLHGRCIDKLSGEFVCNQPTDLRYSNVIYYDKKSHIVNEEQTPLALNFHDSVIFSAINLAYVLGARDICLLGVEAENNAHFEDETGSSSKFPKGNKIIEDLGEWRKNLSKAGCELSTCLNEGKLAKLLPYKQFNAVASLEFPVFLERLKNKVRFKKRCFVFGAGASLNDLPLHKLVGWPVIGTNSSFYLYNAMDALIFGDIGFIQNNKESIYAWQNTREEKPIIFWAAQHLDEESRSKFFRVIDWHHAKDMVVHENIPGESSPHFSIKRSIITSAINCAYWLGASEIYLLGVDLNNDAHFWDPNEEVAEEWGKPVGKFPGGETIADFVSHQALYLKERGVVLATCTMGGLLDGKIKYVSIDDAANPKYLNPNPSFGGHKKS